MCTAEQSLKRGLSDSSAQKSSPDDGHGRDEDDGELRPEDETEKASGKKTRKKAGEQEKKEIPEIKVENSDETPKCKAEDEAVEERLEPTSQASVKGKGRSRSRRRSGLWETIQKGPNVKAEPEMAKSEKSPSKSKSGKSMAIDAPDKEGKLESASVRQVGRGKRKSSSKLVTSPPKGQKENPKEEQVSPAKGQKMNPEEENVAKDSRTSMSEEGRETKVKETPTRRTSKRLSAAPFSTEKLKVEKEVADETKKQGKENDSDSDFEPSTNVTHTSAKKGEEKTEKASITNKRTPRSGMGGKRAELESDAEDFEPPVKKKTPKSGKKKVWCEQNQWFANSVAPKSGKMGKKSKKVWCDQENHWAEVYLEVEGR